MHGTQPLICCLLILADIALMAHFRRKCGRRNQIQRMGRSLHTAVQWHLDMHAFPGYTV